MLAHMGLDPATSRDRFSLRMAGTCPAMRVEQHAAGQRSLTPCAHHFQTIKSYEPRHYPAVLVGRAVVGRYYTTPSPRSAFTSASLKPSQVVMTSSVCWPSMGDAVTRGGLPSTRTGHAGILNGL